MRTPHRAVVLSVVSAVVSTGAVLAGCAPRQASGWREPSLYAYAAVGDATLPIITEPRADWTAQRAAARETLRQLYEQVRRLDHVAKNEAGVKRTDAQWAELSESLASAYAGLRDAASLPEEMLAQGDGDEQIRRAINRSREVVLRFGGGLASDKPLPTLRP